ncbi:dynamin family protein [Natroniella acetigena]|uniref:dynamin family protein n=1 Tax=Natroniella acetigena TaxID=52004 RepID=UPI00200B1606|nr:dynamin family protein [Natroniella acetigena]MCK8827055.1 dynamin family protein [Natroniella acetigena]
MNLVDLLNQSQDYIDDSPLYNINLDIEEYGDDLNIEDTINKYKEQITVLKDKLKAPMNVVVMGEVKAGKSTLLNAIIGDEVCPVDVLEATATITDIHYSPKEKAAIYKGGELEEVGMIDEINQILIDHQGEEEFFEEDILSSIGIPMESLNEFHLVDTPGLSTITESNVAKTKNFIQESDVVLWVFNANHLGQSDVKEELANVARLGKPVIGIINRIDEIEADPRRIKQYIQRNLGLYLRDIFMTSGLKAFEARKNDNQKLLKESGLTDLLDYLREEIEVKSEEIHNDSIASSSQANLRHYIKFNEMYIDKIDFVKEKIDEYTKDLEKEKLRIVNNLELLILNKFNNELFEEERRKILSLADKLSLFSKDVTQEDIKDTMREYFNEDAVKSWWSKMESRLERNIKKEWNKVTQEMDEKLSSEFKQLATKHKRLLIENRDDELFFQSDFNIWSGVGEGAAIAGIGGLGMAAYSAFLGPAAASVTLGYAIGAIVPPLAIGGGALFAGYKLLNKDKNNKEIKRDLYAKINGLKRRLKDEWIEGEVLPSIDEENDKVCTEIKEKFAKKISAGLSSKELDQLIFDIKEHIKRGNSLLAEFELDN